MKPDSGYRVFKSVIELIPHIWPTPLVRLSSLSTGEYNLWAKLEFFNPFSHSIKDRPVWNMVVKALEKCIECGKIYEATSGNVGIALASISNILGIKFRAYIPRPTPRITEVLLKILGAEIIRTDYDTISPEMVEIVKKEAKKDRAMNLNQFENDDNLEAHMKYTAPELDEQLSSIGRSPPHAIIAGIGTSGHISALSMYFKKKYGNRVKVIGVIPAKGSSIPGIKRVEARPKWLTNAEIDEIVEVTRDEAIEASILVARKEGLLVGLSSGAVLSAYGKIKEKYGPGDYVLIFPDDIFKYIEYFDDYFSRKGDRKLFC